MKKSASKRLQQADDAPLTTAELRTAKPARESIPHIVDAIRRRGRPKGESKTMITLRLDKDLIATLRAGGEGWQTRINDLLRAAVGLRG